MHKSIVKVGLFLGAIIVLSGTQQAEALTVDELLATNPVAISSINVTKEADKQEKDNEKEEKTEKDKDYSEGQVLSATNAVIEPKVHVVESGQSLSKIAKIHQTTWKRLYDKNLSIVDPNVIKVGEKVTIPGEIEVLASRELPVAPPVELPSTVTSKPKPTTVKPAPTQSPVSAPRGSSSGNLYSFGYCTWYVKNRRPDIPNNLGNANTWVSRAKTQGMATGSTPRVGAVGQRGMHVVYVESVNSDGSVTISEMNHKGWNVKSTRTVPANYFQYIY